MSENTSSSGRVQLLEESFAICSLSPHAALPSWLNYKGYGFVSRSPDELCIICSEEMAPEKQRTEQGWRCLKIEGDDVADVRRVRAELVGLLFNSGIKTLTQSTYKSDYLLFEGPDLPAVQRVLSEALK